MPQTPILPICVLFQEEGPFSSATNPTIRLHRISMNPSLSKKNIFFSFHHSKRVPCSSKVLSPSVFHKKHVHPYRGLSIHCLPCKSTKKKSSSFSATEFFISVLIVSGLLDVEGRKGFQRRTPSVSAVPSLPLSRICAQT